MGQTKWTAEQKLEMVVRALRGESLADICRQHGISATLFYRWRDDYFRGALAGLKDKRNPQNRDPALEENRRLKKIVAEQALIIDTQKKLFLNEGA